MYSVLLVAPKGNYAGGIARWTGHILSYYQSHEETDLDLGFVDSARNQITSKNPVKRIFDGLRDYRLTLAEIKKELERKHYDVVHFTSSASLGLFRDIAMIKLIKKHKAKSVIHFRFGRIPELSKRKNWEWRLLNKVLDEVNKAIVIDKSSFEVLKNCERENVYSLPNPLSPNITSIVENTNEERIIRRILYVGSCYREKGVFELIEACKEIKNISLVFVGPVDDDVKELIKKAETDNSFLTVLGEKPYSEVIKEMLKCSVFCLPSYTEGFPNVILEAMACGCSIVATNVGAIPEILEEENNRNFGLLVPAKDVGELRIALTSLLENDDLREECGKNAKLRVQERYTLDAIWNSMKNIWSNIATS